MVVNVYGINGVEKFGRKELLNWINELSGFENKKVELLSNGISYCLALSKLFPDCAPLKRVKIDAKFEYDFTQNWKLIQNAFADLKIDREIPVGKLIKAKFQDNLEFLQWFKKFADANGADVTYNVNDENNPVKAPSSESVETKEKIAINNTAPTKPLISIPQMKSAQVSSVNEQLHILETSLDIATKERDFYFELLQKVESVLVSNDYRENPLGQKLLEIIYSKNE